MVVPRSCHRRRARHPFPLGAAPSSAASAALEVARASPNPDPGPTPTPTPTPTPNQVARGVAAMAGAAAFVNHDPRPVGARLTVTLAPGGTPTLVRRTLRSPVGDEL